MYELIDSLNSFSATWSYLVWHVSWQSAMLAALMLCIVHVFRKKLSAPVCYALLLVALLKFAVPPFLSMPTGLFSALPANDLEASWQVPFEISPLDGELDRAPEFDYAAVSTSQSVANLEFIHFNESPAGQSTAEYHEVYGAPANGGNSELDTYEPESNEASSKVGRSYQTSWIPMFKKMSVPSWLMLCHIVGSLLVLCTLIRKTFLVLQLRQQSADIRDKNAIRMFENVCRELGVRRKPKFLESKRTSAPVSFGCYDAVIMLPHGLVNQPELCSAAIAHEVAHFQRRDAWVNALQNLLFVTWWFNPMLWIVNGFIRNLREDCCDDLILARDLVTAEKYSDTLIQIAKSSHNPMSGQISTAFGMTDHPLANRLRRIMNPALERRTSLSVAGILLVILLATVMLPGLRMAIGKEQTRDKKLIASFEQDDGDESGVGEQTLNPDGLKKYGKFKIVDEEGNPVAGASVYCNTSGTNPVDDQPKIVNNTYETDQDGMATIELFDGCTRLRSWTSKTAKVTMFANWEDRKANDLPEIFTLVLQDATSIGGKVVDKKGIPIEGVSVGVRRDGGGIKIDQNVNSRLGSWLSNGSDVTRTDNQGRWQIDNVPAGDDLKFRFQLVHQKYISDDRWQFMSHYKVNLDQLREKTAEMSLKMGVEVKGTITNSEGEPVEDALIVWGDDPYFTQGSQEVRTDSKGRFVTQALKEGEIRLTVVAKGWMPDSRMITVSDSNSGVEDFKLKPGKKLHLKFVDTNGKPLPANYVSIRSWRGHEALYNMRHSNVKESRIPNYSNEKGEYIWDWAPEDEIRIAVGNRALKVTKELTVKAEDQPIIIKLVTPFLFSGNVVNAKNGDAVNKYVITPITYFSDSSAARGIAQSNSIKRFNTSSFQFDDAFSTGSAIRVAFRIEAVGYKTYTTKPFPSDAPSEPIEIRLEPTKIASFTVVDDSGNRVREAIARVVLPDDSLIIGRNRDYFSEDDPYLKSDANGLVQYSTPTENHAIVVANNVGYGEKYLQPGESIGELELRKWSKVEGRLFQDGKPVADAIIIASPIRQLGESHPHVQDYFDTRTDEQGRFSFAKLPPLPTRIKSRLGPWRDYPITSSKMLPIRLQPGETHEINLGGDGFRITGKVKLKGKGAEFIQFRYGLNNLVSTVHVLDILEHARTKNKFQTGKQAEMDKKLWGESRGAKLAASWFVKLQPDGSFLINGVPPGDYRFLIKLYEPPKGCLVDPAAYKFIEFSTSDYKVVDNQINLGQIEIQMEPAARVGDRLPQFSYMDLSGHRKMSSEYQGKYVLLDFWATWCGPCVKMVPDKLKFFEAVSESSEFEFVSLSLDDKLDTVKEFITQNDEVDWQQGFIGNVQKEQRAQALGISSVPMYLFIDPEGTIVARTYDFDEIEKLVREALEID